MGALARSRSLRNYFLNGGSYILIGSPLLEHSCAVFRLHSCGEQNSSSRLKSLFVRLLGFTHFGIYDERILLGLLRLQSRLLLSRHRTRAVHVVALACIHRGIRVNSYLPMRHQQLCTVVDVVFLLGEAQV